jgi:hypothetical protein
MGDTMDPPVQADAPLPLAPLDVPSPPSGPSLSGASSPKEPDEPWLAFAQKPATAEPAEPWLAFQQKAATEAGPVERAAAWGVDNFHRQLTGYKNIGNAFLEGLGDGWTGGAIVPPNQPWGMTPEMSEGLDKWLGYSKVKEQESTVLQSFNESFLFPVVKALAQDTVIQYQALGTAIQPVFQAGSALLRGTTEAIGQAGEEAGAHPGIPFGLGNFPLLGRDIAADIERRAIGGGEPIGIPEPPGPRPTPGTPEAAIEAFRREPFPEARVLITPDIITQARDLGVLGSREEWDGTSVYSRVPEAEAAPDLRTIHDVAREVDPDTFLEYDRLSSMRDNARQQLTDEVERLRTNAEDEIQANAPHTDEIADLKDTLADPRSSARSKRTATARLPGLEAVQEAYLGDQDRYAFLTRETPEIIGLRQEVMQNDERMRDLAPQVSAAYREAATRMPESQAEPAEATPTPPATAPGADIPPPAAGFTRFYHGGLPLSGDETGGRFLTPDLNYARGYAAKNAGALVHYVDVRNDDPRLVKSFDDTGTGQTAPFVHFNAPPEMAARLKPFEAAPVESTPPIATAPPIDIAAHVADRMNKAGRPADESRAMGALVEAYYQTKSERFGGRKGTASDLYQAEAPQIVGRETRGTAAGSIEMVNGRSVLTLFRRADATTAIHEFGHQWFSDMLRDAADPLAPANLRVDAAVVRRWLGVEDGQPLTRRHQERVARGFENYIMEGHAPSKGLARVFEQFKDWMTKVYQTVRQQNVPLNDDLRGVFDRWFSTEPVRRETVVAPEKAGPPPKPRIIGHIMRDERVRESVARQIQSQEIIAYADWQAANRNAATLATPAPASASVEPGARPRTPRSEAQIIREDGVGPAQAKRIQADEFGALADWQAAQRAAGKSTVETPEPPPPAPSVTPEDAQRIAQDMLAPKEAEKPVAPVEPVTATPEPVKAALEPVVAKNFGPAAKDMSPAYVKVPREPKRLIQFFKESRADIDGTMRPGGLKDEDGDISKIIGGPRGKPGLINNRSGQSLDAAGEQATEAGYFPQGRPDYNEIKAAIEQDHNGNPVYSMHDDATVAAYEQAVKHNREIDRLAVEHDIDPRGMTLQAFTKAIEDKVGKEEFDAKALIERARAIDEANEMRDDLTHWHDSEAEHAGRLEPDEFDKLWGEATTSQSLVDGGAGDGEPGVSGGPAGEGSQSAGPVRGRAGDGGPAESAGAGGERPGAGATGEPAAKPEPVPVTKPGPGLAEQIKRRRDEVPKIGNIRLEYILDGKWDDLVAEVMSELSLSGDPRVKAGSVRTMAEHAIFNATADEFYKAKSAWQANPTEANWGELLTAKANHAAATSAWSTGMSNWAYTGHTYQAIIRASKRIEAEMKAAGDTAPPDQQILFQRQQELALLDALDTPEQVGNALVRDMTSTWDKAKNGIISYYLSNILSGIITHLGYLNGGVVNNIIQPLFVIPTQAAVGAIRTARGVGAMDRVLFGEAPASAFGLMNGAMKGIAPAVRALRTGEGYMEGRGGVIPYEQQILPTLLGGTLGYALETPLRAIRAIHVLNYSMRFTAELSRMAYRDAATRLGGQAPTYTEFGAAMQRYLNNVPEEDMAYAHDEATRSALMKPPAAGSTQAKVSEILDQHPALRLIAPFPQIGMNLAEEGFIRTTPLGLLNRNVRGDLQSGGARFDIAAGRMAAGSGIAAGVVGLALNGLITGAGPTDPNKRRLLEATGWAPFAVKWGDSYIPLRKALGPLGELVGVSATAADAIHAPNGQEALKAISKGFGAAVLDETWLRGIHDVFDAATHAEQKLGYYLTNMAEGFVPFSQFLSQTARQVDPYTRQANGFIEHLMARTPFASARLEPQIGPFGDPVRGHSTMGIHAVMPDPVADRMLALGMGATPFPRDIKGIPMTEAQETAYGTYAGHLERQLLTPLVTAPGFDQLPAGMQIKQIDKRITISRENAAKVVQAANPQIISDGVLLKQKILLEGRAGAMR